MAYTCLELELDARGVLTIALHRPEVRNAFNEVLISELSSAFAKRATQKEVRLVVLRGKGPVFCAGGDLNWMKRAASLGIEENFLDTHTLAQLFDQLNEFPKPVIGAFQGAAIGGGVGLVSVCDYGIATKETVFSLSEVRLGLVPACIGPFVISKIGPSHARSLFISAERFFAPRALEIGLVHEVVSDEVALDSAVERVVSNILQAGPHAVSAAKELILNLSWPERRAEIKDPLEYISRMLAELRISPEGQEGVRAFLEKRKPTWMAAQK
jgi:methylglutaconyl-CoA hydratase